MGFSEPVRLLEANGFRLVKEKGFIRYYAKCGHPNLVRVGFHGSKEVPTGTCHAILKRRGFGRGERVLKLDYSIIIEATHDPNFFGFYSPDLKGFTGVGHSVEDCLYKAQHGIVEHVQTMREQGLPVPPRRTDPTVLIQNEKKRKSA